MKKMFVAFGIAFAILVSVFAVKPAIESAAATKAYNDRYTALCEVSEEKLCENFAGFDTDEYEMTSVESYDSTGFVSSTDENLDKVAFVNAEYYNVYGTLYGVPILTRVYAADFC